MSVDEEAGGRGAEGSGQRPPRGHGASFWGEEAASGPDGWTRSERAARCCVGRLCSWKESMADYALCDLYAEGGREGGGREGRRN